MGVPWRREGGLLSGEVREGWTEEVTCELGLRTSGDVPGIYKDWRGTAWGSSQETEGQAGISPRWKCNGSPDPVGACGWECGVVTCELTGLFEAECGGGKQKVNKTRIRKTS